MTQDICLILWLLYNLFIQPGGRTVLSAEDVSARRLTRLVCVRCIAWGYKTNVFMLSVYKALSFMHFFCFQIKHVKEVCCSNQPSLMGRLDLSVCLSVYSHNPQMTIKDWPFNRPKNFFKRTFDTVLQKNFWKRYFPIFQFSASFQFSTLYRLVSNKIVHITEKN